MHWCEIPAVLHVIDHFSKVPPSCRGGIVSIGNFDGVHVGHRQIVHGMRSLARSIAAPTVAFTFDPHPVSLLRPAEAPAPLTWTERKAELLNECGADEVVALRTNLEFLRLTADEFFAEVVIVSLAACGLVEGPNFGFGRDRSGSIATLTRLCAAAGLRLEIVDPLDGDGGIVSSSRVRDAIAAGQVELAARLLGRPHRVRGRVGRGAGRGAGLGFPTANLEACDVVVPGDGVYAGRANVTGRDWPVAANVGANPTFGESARKIEAHVIGFSGDLAGQTIEIDFLARLRDTRKFAGPAELVEQLRRDIEEAAGKQ